MSLGLSEAPGIGRLLIESRFSVPNHQRDYSWTNDEVRELLEDVTEAVKTPSSIYFVGLMVFRSGEDSSTLVVLDGQQRLATSVILFSAIRAWLKQYDEYRQDADDIQRDYIGRRELGKSTLEARITMNSANDQIFSDYIVQSATLTDLETALQRMKKRDRNRRIIETAIYIHKWVREIAERFGSRVEAAAYFFDLVNYVRDKVGIVKLVVPSEEMAYTIFETLNDRGLDLPDYP